MIETKHTFCRICESLCGLEVEVENNKVIGIRPDDKHVATDGFSCVKGLRQHEMYASPDRLKYPMKKVDGKHVRISWDQPTIPRAAIKDCEFEGYEIKKGEQVFVSPYFTHRMAEIWSEPNKFDPERFNKERAEDKNHKHAWIPFGGGAHKCLGVKFAELQVKLILFHLLKSYKISVEPDYEMPYSPAPIGKPSDLLPLKLTAI